MLLIGLRALAVTGFIVILQHHIDLDWWEGGVLSFSAMMLLGTLYEGK